MLTQYRLILKPEGLPQPRQELAYRLYAALLARAPADFAVLAHEDVITPMSQFLTFRERDELCWTVNLLGERSEACLSELLEDLMLLELERGGRVTVTERSRRVIPDVDALFALAEQSGGPHRLAFRTPTAFKSKGQYLNLPTTRLILQSLIRKWNGSIAECPIEDEDGQGLESLAAGIHCTGLRLQDRSYYLKGKPIPGFVGNLVLENRLDGFHRLLANALFLFSSYAGVGIKTTLGMGGVERIE